MLHEVDAAGGGVVGSTKGQVVDVLQFCVANKADSKRMTWGCASGMHTPCPPVRRALLEHASHAPRKCARSCGTGFFSGMDASACKRTYLEGVRQEDPADGHAQEDDLQGRRSVIGQNVT